MHALRQAMAAITAASLAGTALAHEPDSAELEAANRLAIAEAARAGEAWIEGFRAYRHIPALSAAVVREDTTVWAKGFGTTDRAGKRAATPDTVYSVCSISKLFTSVALMQQWEAGAVRLDEPIATYLPWAKLAADSRESVPITLRGLLTHSAGLPRESDFPYWSGPDFPFPAQAAIRERYASQAPLYPASTTFQYSNLGLTLVGETVEAVSGKSFAQQVTASVLEPLGLKDTRPGIPVELYGKQMAVGWGALEADGSRPPVRLFDPAGITPAAGFTSSVADLARFASWNMRLLRTGKAEVLRASTLREMTRVQFETPDGETRWGLGYAMDDVDGARVYGHGGSCPGYRSTVAFEPKSGLGVAVAMNAMDDPDAIAKALMSLLKARGEAGVYPAPEGEKDFTLGDYAGRYEGQPWGADFAVLPWAGGLIEVPLDGSELRMPTGRLKPLGKDRFLVLNRKGEERDTVIFERDATGRVMRMVQHSNPSLRIGGI